MCFFSLAQIIVNRYEKVKRYSEYLPKETPSFPLRYRSPSSTRHHKGSAIFRRHTSGWRTLKVVKSLRKGEEGTFDNPDREPVPDQGRDVLVRRRAFVVDSDRLKRCCVFNRLIKDFDGRR